MYNITVFSGIELDSTLLFLAATMQAVATLHVI